MKVTEEPLAKVKPQDRIIPSDNICGSCLYNIPQGTLLLMLPGLTLLIIGVVIVVLHRDSTWTEGMLNVGVIFLVLGSIMTAVVFIFCIRSWTKHRPKPKTPHNLENGVAARSSTGIELVGVYRITSTGSQERCDVITVPAHVTAMPATAIL